MEIIQRHSDIQSDEDQKELVDNLMERQCYSIIKKRMSSESPDSGSEEKKERKPSIKKERKKSIIKKTSPPQKK